MHPAIGSPAPDFTADTTNGPVTLSNFRGKQAVLLAFFPLAFTSTCTTELCAFTDDYAEFAKHDVAVIPMSVDAVPSLKAFKEHYKMKEELASDFKRVVSKLYGVLREDTFFSERAYFLIDKAGVLRWSFVEAKLGDHRPNAEILAEVAKLG